MAENTDSELYLCEALWLLGAARSLLFGFDTPATDDLRREINVFADKVTCEDMKGE